MLSVIFLLMILVVGFILIHPVSAASANVSPFQKEETKSKPFKVVVNLEFTKEQYKHGVGKVSVYYEDSDGLHKTKIYDFDEMMKRAWPNHVKVKVKFPRDTASHFEDFLICVKNLQNEKHRCLNDSRSPGVEKERIHLKVP